MLPFLPLLLLLYWCPIFNSQRPSQFRNHFADDIFKCIFLNENVWISIKISLKFVPQGPIDNIPLVQIMAWCWYQSLCPKWVNRLAPGRFEMKFQISDFQTDPSDWWLRCLLWNCPQDLTVNFGSGGGLVLSGNKVWPEPMLTQIYVVIWYQ